MGTNLVDHARAELGRTGDLESDPAFSQSLIAAVAALTSYGHSGGSMMVAVERLGKILRHEALTPLTASPDEWTDQSGWSGHPLWQNTRDSRAMSFDQGTTYWLVDDPQRTIHHTVAGDIPNIVMPPAGREDTSS